MTLHLIKLAVGARSVQDIVDRQAQHGRAHPPLRHRTRSTPKRAAEILQGGSIYWVVAGMLSARQPIRDIRPAKRDDGTACTDLILDPALVLVCGRPVKAFQGWRYLAAGEAPPDLGRMQAGFAELPESMRRDLALLALI